MSRRAAVLAAAVFLVGAASLPSPAAAGTAYRYWSYWHWMAGSWEYSRIGPAGSAVADGSVEGWHFAVQVDATGGTPPSISGDFQAICGDVPSQKGKRVAVVIDYGSDKGAPALRTACADVPSSAKGFDVLAAVARDIRIDKGLICAIDGYPKPPECGSLVRPSASSTAVPSATSKPTPSPALTESRNPAAAATPTPPRSPIPTATPTVAPTPLGTPTQARAEPQPSSSANTGASTRSVEAQRSSKGSPLFATLAGSALVLVLAGAAAWRYRGRAR